MYGHLEFQCEVQYNWYPDMAFDGGKSEGGTLDKGWVGGVGLADMGAREVQKH